MEMPHLGQNCSEKTCNKLDFLPMKCDACKKIFCSEHFSYVHHNCPSAYKKNVQVPECPLCNIPIPVGRDLSPDAVVGAHIDSECQSDPAKSRRKVFTNKCSYKGCKIKEIVPVLCNECKLNYCLKHRHPTDHKCEGKDAQRKMALNAAFNRVVPQRNHGITSGIQCALDEDEALARALQLSLQDQPPKTVTQEEMDRQLAFQLQQQEQGATGARARQQGARDRCRLS